MNISPEEAIALLERWRATETPLRIHLSGEPGDLQGTVHQVAGTVIAVVAPEEIKVDIRGAEFNGDARGATLNQSAYPVCEHPQRYSVLFSYSSAQQPSIPVSRE
jgi:hypothetical protein